MLLILTFKIETKCRNHHVVIFMGFMWLLAERKWHTRKKLLLETGDREDEANLRACRSSSSLVLYTTFTPFRNQSINQEDKQMH